MQIYIDRFDKLDSCTIGRLRIDSDPFTCYTLEDKIRRIKIIKETAIPSGNYQVIISYSPRFKTYMPLLLNVPNFRGVRIHTGNTKEDTEGCILLGNLYQNGSNKILESRKAYNAFLKILKKAERRERILITIK